MSCIFGAAYDRGLAQGRFRHEVTVVVIYVAMFLLESLTQGQEVVLKTNYEAPRFVGIFLGEVVTFATAPTKKRGKSK